MISWKLFSIVIEVLITLPMVLMTSITSSRQYRHELSVWHSISRDTGLLSSISCEISVVAFRLNAILCESVIWGIHPSFIFDTSSCLVIPKWTDLYPIFPVCSSNNRTRKLNFFCSSWIFMKWSSMASAVWHPTSQRWHLYFSEKGKQNRSTNGCLILIFNLNRK